MLSRVSPNIALFLIASLMVWQREWMSGGIAWSMWLASLGVGYCYILIGTLSKGMFSHDDTDPPKMGKRHILSSFLLLVFFTIHFVGFHWLYSIFLGNFFPLEPGAFEREIAGGYATSFSLVKTLDLAMYKYWGFLAIAIVFHFPDMLNLLQGRVPFTIATPYAAVLKNHVIIVVLCIFIYFLDFHYIIYMVLFAYFFPFDEILTSLHESVDDTVDQPDQSDLSR